MPAAAEEHQLGRRVGGPQRLQCRQGDDQVAERVGPEHGQPADAGDQGPTGWGGPRPAWELRRMPHPVRIRWIMAVVDWSGRYGRISTRPPSASTSGPSGTPSRR